jgi:hypothetical protein
VLRFLLAAGACIVFAAPTEAAPVWRSVPTPMPPEIHLSKARPPWLGPVWRQTSSSRLVSVSVLQSDTPDTSVVTLESEAAAEPPAAPAPVAPAIPAAPAPVVAAKAPEPAPPAVPVAKPAEVAAPVVAADKAPDPTPVAAPASAPAMEAASPPSRWLDYLGALAMAIVVGGAIFFLTRDRKRLA